MASPLADAAEPAAPVVAVLKPSDKRTLTDEAAHELLSSWTYDPDFLKGWRHEDGSTTFAGAAEEGRVDLMIWLTSQGHGNLINEGGQFGFRRPLYQAIQRAKDQVGSALLPSPPPPPPPPPAARRRHHHHSTHNITARAFSISWLVEHGQAAIWLIEHGASTSFIQPKDFAHACRYMTTEFVEYLIRIVPPEHPPLCLPRFCLDENNGISDTEDNGGGSPMYNALLGDKVTTLLHLILIGVPARPQDFPASGIVRWRRGSSPRSLLETRAELLASLDAECALRRTFIALSLGCGVHARGHAPLSADGPLRRSNRVVKSTHATPRTTENHLPKLRGSRIVRVRQMLGELSAPPPPTNQRITTNIHYSSRLPRREGEGRGGSHPGGASGRGGAAGAVPRCRLFTHSRGSRGLD